MSRKEKKSIDIEASQLEVDVDKRIIQGYFSIFTPDSGRDLTRKGTFTKTMSERGPRDTGGGLIRSKIKMAYNHKSVIGIPILLREDDHGAYFEGRVSETQLGNEVLTMVKDGTIDGCSFEYKVLNATYPKDDKSVGRIITEAKLYETGPVDYPMHEDAGIIGTKSHESIGELCDQLLCLIHKKSDDIKDIVELKALYDELTERLTVAEEESLPEIKSQPDGDLVLDRLLKLQKKMETYNG